MASAAVVFQVTDVIEATITMWAGVAFSDGFGCGKVGLAHMGLQLPLREEPIVARRAAEHPGGYFRAVVDFVVFHPCQVFTSMAPFEVFVQVCKVSESHRAMRTRKSQGGGSCGEEKGQKNMPTDKKNNLVWPNIKYQISKSSES